MILQIDPRFTNKFLINEGCANMCVLREVNRKLNLPLDPTAIEMYFDQMKKIKGKARCFTEDNLIVWVNAFKFFGIKVLYQREEEGSDFCFYNWFNPRTGKYHFTCGEKGIVTYDPMGYSVTVREGYIHSYRGFKFI